MHWMKHIPQDLFVDLLIDWLIIWLCGTNLLQMIPLISKMINMTDFWLSYSLDDVPLISLVLDFQVVLKNPCFITCDNPTKQVWFSLKMLDNVLTHLHAVLLLIIIQQSWHHFYAAFPHAQIISDNLPNTVLFLFSWYTIIQTVNWQLPHNTCSMLTSVLLVEGLQLLKSSFTSLYSSLNCFCFSKYTCTWYGVITIHLLKHFKCLWSFS